jgi:hypothetical protein
MAIVMIAVGRYYDKANRKEYPDGGRFSVETDGEADRLERLRKAKRAGSGVGFEQSTPSSETENDETQGADIDTDTGTEKTSAQSGSENGNHAAYHRRGRSHRS